MTRSLTDRLRWMPPLWTRLRGLDWRAGRCRKPKIHVKELSDHMLRDLGLGDTTQASDPLGRWP